MKATMTVEAKLEHWPVCDHADCACPHCGHVDKHQITNAREWGLDARDGQCGACYGDYVVVAKNGRVLAEKLPKDARTFLIRHRYDIGDQGVTIMAPQGFDVLRAAIYMQFWAEEWFGAEKVVTNLGLAAALVSFYDCKHTARNSFGGTIDMYADREAACPKASELMADEVLTREGLRGFPESP
jgi:hypothetical protein